MGSLPRCDGAEKEAQMCARFGLEILMILETLHEHQGMYESEERAHEMFCRHRRIDSLELARCNAFAHDALSHRMHHLLVRVNDVPTMLDRHQNDVMDAPFRQKIISVMGHDRHDELFEALACGAWRTGDRPCLFL